MFKLLYVVIFLFILFEIEAKISDKRLCANENCTKPISHAKTILRYHTGSDGVLSFEANADVIVYSKSAGSNMDLWGVEIKGVRGYVPKAYLRETRVLTKDPKFMLTTQEINQQVPSNETEPSTVIEPDKASDYTVVEGTTIYTDPDDAIVPTPSSVILSTNTIDNIGAKEDDINSSNIENDINNEETVPLESRNNDDAKENEFEDKDLKTKEETNLNNLENNINKEETAELESKTNNVIKEKEPDDKTTENENADVKTETKESLTGQIVQKFIDLIGGDKKDEEEDDDELDDEEFEEDSAELEDEEDDEEYDDSEEEGYVTDDLDDKSDENNGKDNKIPIEEEKPTVKIENLEREDSVKLRQLLSENDNNEKTATESKANAHGEDGTKLESDNLNSNEVNQEEALHLKSSEKDVNEQHTSETVTDVPLTEPPGFDLPFPKYDQDYVTPNPLENVGHDGQEVVGEVTESTAENEKTLGEPTDESTQNKSQETGESATDTQEIKSDEKPEFAQSVEAEAGKDQPLENAEELEEEIKSDVDVAMQGDTKPGELQIESETTLQNDGQKTEQVEDTKGKDTDVNTEAQEEKLPVDVSPENHEGIKSVEASIESEKTLENEAAETKDVEDTEIRKEDIKKVDENQKNENLEKTEEVIIEEMKPDVSSLEDSDITLADIAAESAETMTGIFSGITNLFGGSSQNQIEEAAVGNKEAKQDQNVDVEKEANGNVEANSADIPKDEEAPVEDKDTKEDQNMNVEKETNTATPQNIDQIVTNEQNLLSMLEGGKRDHQISQSPDVITEIPIIESPVEGVQIGYTPQDTLQEQKSQDYVQEYAPPDVLQDENYIKDNLQNEDVEQNENVHDSQEEEKISDIPQIEDDGLDTFHKEDDAAEATIDEVAPDVKENLGDHIFDVHDQLLSKNSVEYGSCPAGESDCPTDISVVQKQLEMEEIVQAPLYGDFINLLTLLGVTGISVALFLLGFIKIDKNRQESGLIAKINTLEKALLVASKENALLIDRVAEIQNETAAENDRISSEEYDSLNKIYQDVLTAKSVLEEQVQTLEKELENSTEVGLELNRMLSDIISSQNGSDILIANVEQLQRQLVEQQGTINAINDTLNLKDTENHELQLELEIKNKKVTHLQTELDKMAMNLFKVEEDKEQMQAKLEGEIIELKDQLEKNKNSFNSTRTSMLDEINNLKSKYGDIQRNLEVKMNEYNILKDNFNQIKTIKNNSEALESLLNASSMKAELQQLQRDNQTLNDVLRQEQQTKFTLEKQIEIALQEAQSYKSKYDEADKEKLEARTKLEVLSNYFKEKEAQLQKELSKHESMWVEQQGEATSSVERIKYMQEELQNCKSQNELLKQEIVAQEVELKSQISVLEKKAHESWVSARQAERRLEDAKQEAAQLRNRLTLKERSYVEDKTQNRMQSPLEQNGDVAISPLHVPVETPASPPLLYGTRDHLTTSPPLPNLPPFLPPPPGVPFIPPPMPGVPAFMPPPPSMFPVDHRPPPLGRMSSPPPPLNSRYSPDSRYSPYDRNSPSPPYDDEYGSSPPLPMPIRSYSPYSRDDRRDFKRPPPPLRTNGRNKGAMSSGSGNSNESLEKINRHHSKV